MDYFHKNIEQSGDKLCIWLKKRGINFYLESLQNVKKM